MWTYPPQYFPHPEQATSNGFPLPTVQQYDAPAENPYEESPYRPCYDDDNNAFTFLKLPTVLQTTDEAPVLNQNPDVSTNPNLSVNPNPNLSVNPNAILSVNPNPNLSVNPNPNLDMNSNQNLAMNPNPNLSMNPIPNFSMNPNLNFSMNPNPHAFSFHSVPTYFNPCTYPPPGPAYFNPYLYPPHVFPVGNHPRAMQPNMQPMLTAEGENYLKNFVAANAPMCDEKIRYKNRDYYALPLSLNVAKTEDDNVVYNLTAKRPKSKKKTPIKNPLSTKMTVKKLLKLVESQHQMLPEVKIETNSNSCAAEASAAVEVIESGANDNQQEIAAGSDSLDEQLKEAAKSCEEGVRRRKEGAKSEEGVRRRKHASSKRNPVKYTLTLPSGAPLLEKTTSTSERKVRNRSYEFFSLQIGDFMVTSTEETQGRNKLKFFFSRNLMLYDFEYKCNVPNDFGGFSAAHFIVMISVPLNSIKGAIFSGREFELHLHYAPRLTCGYNKAKGEQEPQPSISDFDITNGQLNAVLKHSIVLPRSQGELIKKYLLDAKPDLFVSDQVLDC